MNGGQAAWLLLLLFALILMLIGFQGTLGVMFAILFCPTRVTIQE